MRTPRKHLHSGNPILPVSIADQTRMQMAQVCWIWEYIQKGLIEPILSV